ncbi:hypothetical protein H0H92_001102 [Tricholoma furcatifolium]|nr:hypothetical protein H0H92_001102 [Tricholoma furcatifolium]
MVFFAALLVFNGFLAAFALPIEDVSSSLASRNQLLEPRVSPGSYAIYSPEGESNISMEGNLYYMFVKFGDGQIAREAKYTTHNPTFSFYYRPATSVTKQGEEMEKATFGVLAQHFPSQIKILKSPIGKDLEWYRVLLGNSPKKAKCIKRAISRVMEAYKDLPETASASELSAYAKRVIDGVTTAQKGISDGHLEAAGQFFAGISDCT